MRAITPILFLLACQPDPLIPELVARPAEVNLYPALVGPDGPHQRVRLFNPGEATVRIDEWTAAGEGAARLQLRGPLLPVDVAPGQRVELTMDIGPLDGLTEEEATIEVLFRGYSGIGEAASLSVPVRVVVPGRCDADEDGFVAGRCGGDDCVDQNASIFPGATESCNGVDDDCDGVIDPPGTEGIATFYVDADGDGFGDRSQPVERCQAGVGEVADASDCDDTNWRVNPGEPERCNGIDDDCDDLIDEDAFNAITHYADVDADGFGDATTALTSCDLPAGRAIVDGDCDDNNAAARPGASELCNGVDDDCDAEVDNNASDARTWFPDADVDGWGGLAGRVRACEAPAGFLPTQGDCDDADAAVFPGAVETCNAKDDDCDGVIDEDGEGDRTIWYRDADGDSYGNRQAAQATCGTPAGYVADATDCDDLDRLAFPGAPERCNGKDDNCNNQIDDGAVCVELCGNGADDDLDGLADCDDPDCAAEPACIPAEVCNNGQDDDRDGLPDCEDPDCFAAPECRVEICFNGVDDDQNGLTDCEDPVCASQLGCALVEVCANMVDDNGNGLIDCEDPECFGDPTCLNQDFEICGNGQDDDANGLTDCEDPMCAGTPDCAPQSPGIRIVSAEYKGYTQRRLRELACITPLGDFTQRDGEAHYGLTARGVVGSLVYTTADGRQEECEWFADEISGYTDIAIQKGLFDNNPDRVQLLPMDVFGFGAAPGCPISQADLPPALWIEGTNADAAAPLNSGYFPVDAPIQRVPLWFTGPVISNEGLNERNVTQEQIEIGPISVPCDAITELVELEWQVAPASRSVQPWPWAPAP